MKQVITLLAFILSSHCLLSQNCEIRLLDEPATTDSACISDMNIFSVQKADASHTRITKAALPGMIRHISACVPGMRYINSYIDKSFELTIPAWLGRFSYAFGNNNFSISFNDCDTLDRSIVLFYDFNNSYTNTFFKDMKSGKQKATIKRVNNKDIFLYTDAENKHYGRIFLDNNRFIFYRTTNSIFEKELQEAISTMTL